MWKYVTRGIRETLERRANRRTNLYSQNSQENSVKCEIKTNLVSNQKLLAPTFSTFNNGFCDSTKSTGAKDKKEDSKWDAKHNWTDAVGWTGVLAVSWVVCQSLCLRRRFFEDQRHETNATFQNKLLHLPEVHLKRLLAQVLCLKPQFIFPVVHAVSDVKKVDAATETDCTSSQSNGPLTAEEALKEAESKFSFAHQLYLGQCELNLGITALKDERYEDALKNFSTGAKLFSPASIFNLGLCHELGFGTKVDDIKAAKYYDRAAEMGHAGAMYNLAIFHAQGRGNFSVDINKARTLFKRAADLGQEKAKEALMIDEKYTIESTARKNESILIKKKSSMKNVLKNTIFNMAKYEDVFISKSNKKSDSYFIDKEIDNQNSTEAFLNILGINETPLQPIANSC
ncbi:uncharacterized protein LOC127281777 [Leptopilina boulardi]|uniref:uncharacterized protein LOC127281777 n=1 Tax=Leptopilina boulardi TaxID=63433 RepID=UPI0021F66475|nr:uncharacterized protein LOC127281777 [Leptopilina boulardi]